MVWTFERGLKDAFLIKLKELSGTESWFRDVLNDPDLIIGVRNNYINVYTSGQSLFKAAWNSKTNEIEVSTHPKFLLDPDLKDPIFLEGDGFQLSKINPMIAHFKGNDTLKRMKRAAKLYSGIEKDGVHKICRAGHNHNIVDLEIALTQSADQDDEEIHIEAEGDKAPRRGAVAKRMDIAKFDEIDGKIHLCFWEAKDYGNAELWAAADTPPPVVEQVRDYQALIKRYHGDILKSYKTIAQNLVSLAEMSERKYKVDELIQKVAAGQEFIVDPLKIGVVFFGFSDSQKKSERHKRMVEKLESAKLAVAAAGDSKGVKLNWNGRTLTR